MKNRVSVGGSTYMIENWVVTTSQNRQHVDISNETKGHNV
jgi:hypothetical protein